MIPTDGQSGAADVVRPYDTAAVTGGKTLATVQRCFRMDGLSLTLVSTSYNVLVRRLWPGLALIDVNGSPTLLPTEVVRATDLRPKDWLLDPELTERARQL